MTSPALCPQCGAPRKVSRYPTRRGEKRVYVHTTCGSPACRRREANRKRAMRYLEGR